jgi:hypothetical protein
MRNKAHTSSENRLAVRTWVAFAEASQIFAQYGGGELDITVEHDQIWGGPDADLVNRHDAKMLRQLGWRIDDDINRWTFYV